MAYKIDNDKCSSCGDCKETCPVECISEDNGVYTIDADECIDCGACEAGCPSDAISQE